MLGKVKSLVDNDVDPESISRNEFLRVFDPKSKKQVSKFHYDAVMEKACRELFNDIDIDNNGHIDFIEFSSIFKDLGMSVSDDSIRRQFRAIDKNMDDDISYEEFKTFVKEQLIAHHIKNEELIINLR